MDFPLSRLSIIQGVYYPKRACLASHLRHESAKGPILWYLPIGLAGAVEDIAWGKKPLEFVKGLLPFALA